MKRLEWSVQIKSSDLWLVTTREGERKRNTINGRKKRQLSMERRVRNKREMTEKTQTEEKEKKLRVGKQNRRKKMSM